MAFFDTTACIQLAEKLAIANSQLKKLDERLQAIESELDIAHMQLEAAHQENYLLVQERFHND